MGAGGAVAKGARAQTPTSDPRQRGGQASLGSFGLPGSAKAFAQNKATTAKVKETAATSNVVAFPVQEGHRPIPVRDMQPRVVGGLTFAQRRAQIASLISQVSPTPASTTRAVPSMESLIAEQRAQREAAAASVPLAVRLSCELSRLLGTPRPKPVTTPEMRAAGRAADAREARYSDLEGHFYFGFGYTAPGSVEIALAMEG